MNVFRRPGDALSRHTCSFSTKSIRESWEGRASFYGQN